MALAKAQAEITAPERNRTVKVTPKSGGTGYSFKYATLDAIIETVRKPLTSNHLWFTQILKQDQQQGIFILDTRLMHASGQWLACQTPLIVEGATNQSFGSALTFMRRYALTSLLGIAAEEDDDANIADGNTVHQVQDRKPAPPGPDVVKEHNPVIGKVDGIPPFSIEVFSNSTGTGNDWVRFGKDLLSFMKVVHSAHVVFLWRDANDLALKNMEQEAPKAFANLSLAIMKIVNELERNPNDKS